MTPAGTDDISMLALVRYTVASQPDSSGPYHIGVIAGKGYVDSVGTGYGLLVGADNRMRWQIRDHDTLCEAASDDVLNDGHWRLAVGVCDRDDSTGLRLYIDGVRQSAPVDPTILSGIALNGSWAFAIGSRQGASDGSWYWDFAGSVAMVCVWKRVLTESEIHALQRDPFGLFACTHTIARVASSVQPFVACAGAVHATTSASAAMQVVRNLSGSIGASTSVGGALAVTGFVSLSGTVGGHSRVRAALTTEPQAPSENVSRTERPWRREALLNGATRTAFQLGTALTQGWFWVRSRGCTAVYRGSGITSVDLARILYVAEPDAQEIRLPEYLPHPAGSTYCYLVRRFNSRGDQDRTTSAAAVLRIGPDGQLAAVRPNTVVALSAEWTRGTGLRLVWFYNPLDQETAPGQFHIYRGGPGTTDPGGPTGIVSYRGRRYYCYSGGLLSDGQHVLTIRTASRKGIEGRPSTPLVRQIAASTPEPAVILTATAL